MTFLLNRHLQDNFITSIDAGVFNDLTSLYLMWADKAWKQMHVAHKSNPPFSNLNYNQITLFAAGTFSNLASLTNLWVRMIALPSTFLCTIK